MYSEALERNPHNEKLKETLTAERAALDKALQELTVFGHAQGRLLPNEIRKALSGGLFKKLIEARTPEQVATATVNITELLVSYLPDLPIVKRRRGPWPPPEQS